MILRIFPLLCILIHLRAFAVPAQREEFRRLLFPEFVCSTLLTARPFDQQRFAPIDTVHFQPTLGAYRTGPTLANGKSLILPTFDGGPLNRFALLVALTGTRVFTEPLPPVSARYRPGENTLSLDPSKFELNVFGEVKLRISLRHETDHLISELKYRAGAPEPLYVELALGKPVRISPISKFYEHYFAVEELSIGGEDLFYYAKYYELLRSNLSTADRERFKREIARKLSILLNLCEVLMDVLSRPTAALAVSAAREDLQLKYYRRTTLFGCLGDLFDGVTIHLPLPHQYLDRFAGRKDTFEIFDEDIMRFWQSRLADLRELASDGLAGVRTVQHWAGTSQNWDDPSELIDLARALHRKLTR